MGEGFMWALFIIGAAIVGIVVQGWCTMISIGILHSYFPALQAFGYGSSFMIGLALPIMAMPGIIVKGCTS